MSDKEIKAVVQSAMPPRWIHHVDSALIKRGLHHLSIATRTLPRELWRMPLYGNAIDRSGFPPTLTVVPENIPTELASLRRWVAWDWSLKKDLVRKSVSSETTQDGIQDPTHVERVTLYKVPISPITGDSAAGGTASWTSLFDAVEFAHRVGVAGVGLVFTTNDRVVGVDLDRCVQAVQPGSAAVRLESWARELASELDTYTELSPSGTGVHILALGDHAGLFEFVPPNEGYEQTKPMSPFFRAFDSQGGARPLGFLTMTGNRLNDFPYEFNDRAGVVNGLLARFDVPTEPPAEIPETPDRGLRWLGHNGHQPTHPLFGDFPGVASTDKAGRCQITKNGVYRQIDPITGHLQETFSEVPTRDDPLRGVREDESEIRITSAPTFTFGTDVRTGRELWRVRGSLVKGLPTDEVCYVAGYDFLLAAIQVRTGIILWQIEGEGSWSFSYPAIDEELLFKVLDGLVHCANWLEGRLLWSKSVGEVLTHILSINSRMVLLHQRTRLIALQRTTGDLLWSKVLDTRPDTDDEIAYLWIEYAEDANSGFVWQKDGRLLAINLDDGSTLWEFDAGLRDDDAAIHADVGLWSFDDVLVAQSSHVLYGLAKSEGEFYRTPRHGAADKMP